jgi:hypothetical protein
MSNKLTKENNWRKSPPIIIKNGQVIPDGLQDCFLSREVLFKEMSNVAKLNRAIGESYREDIEYKKFCEAMMDGVVDRTVNSLLLKHGKRREYNITTSKPVPVIPEKEDDLWVDPFIDPYEFIKLNKDKIKKLPKNKDAWTVLLENFMKKKKVAKRKKKRRI